MLMNAVVDGVRVVREGWPLKLGWWVKCLLPVTLSDTPATDATGTPTTESP